jgi:hypothetical protein
MLLRSVLLRVSFMLEKGASMLAYNRSTKHSSVEGMDVGTAYGTTFKNFSSSNFSLNLDRHR